MFISITVIIVLGHIPIALNTHMIVPSLCYDVNFGVAAVT